ncbi:hypothetical protein [Paenibacillus lautus]|uniref:hypothetical protein n=1 Tax=Paenibacillus lautus TaxID=1401 RepID=UPI003D9A3FB0
MDRLIQEAISGNNLHYQQPFFKVSDKDTEESLRQRITELYEHGIYSMVLEYAKSNESLYSTTKFDATWWERLDYVSKICGELGMTFWMQDAAPFPSGSANGAFQEAEHQGKSKKFIAERHMDIKGPVQDAYISVDKLVKAVQGNVLEALNYMSDIPNRFLHAVAVAKSADGEGYDPASLIDLTHQVTGGVLRTDLGPGNWRIFIFIETYSGGRKHFMNLLDEASVRVQIDAVHAPHYKHLKHELGKTWMGFFYDEPELGNLGGYVFDSLPGKIHKGMTIPLPWSKDVPAMLEERMGVELAELLPSLWYDFGETTYTVRHAYMDIITKLIARNYNGQVYKWCEERGITYIGHVLEDENSHTRLGCGTGNIFRVMEGQHMAGIDLIGGQLWPGLDDPGMSWYGAIDGDGEFYHYGLAKLGSSAGHIDPKKQGRSICELLGLYGDIAGSKLRKFVIDHLLVNGINHFIPAQAGMELDLTFSRKLNQYTDRMCHILGDGQHVAPVAILYHADAEWSGGFQYFQKPAKALATNQIDYDVIPKDVFMDRETYGTRIESGKLHIHKESYSALVIPYCQRIPNEMVSVIKEAEQAGFPVYFVDRHPEGYCESTEELPPEVYSCRSVPLGKLAEVLRKDGIYEISLSNPQHYLRYLHYKREHVDIYMFHNEEPVNEIETVVSIPSVKPVRLYDVMDNRLYIPNVVVKNGMTEVPLTLGQFESVLFLFGEDFGETDSMPDLRKDELQTLWDVSFESLDSQPSPESFTTDHLFDVGASSKLPNFYGRIKYTTSFAAGVNHPRMLDLGRVSECVEVFLNGEYLGAAVAAPYRFELNHVIRNGMNLLEIIVTNNRTRSKDSQTNDSISISLMSSTYASLEPCGLLGPVRII